jgi:hypothetical protein
MRLNPLGGIGYKERGIRLTLVYVMWYILIFIEQSSVPARIEILVPEKLKTR